jgi:hypothetical protein
LRNRLLILLMALVGTAGVLAGCGGGGGTTAGESSTTAAEGGGPGKAEGGRTEAARKDEIPKPEGGAEAPSGAGGTPSAQFVKRANAICGRVIARISGEVEAYERQHEGSGGLTPEELQSQAFVAAFAPNLEGEIEELRALAAETGEEDRIVPFLEALERGVDGEPTSIIEAIEQFKQADKLAARYGLAECRVA